MDSTKKKSYSNEDFMDNFNIIGGNNNINIENDDININKINQIGTNIEIENKNKEEILNEKKNINKTKKSKSSQLAKFSTEIKTYQNIKEKTIEKTNLLELDFRGINLAQLIQEEEDKANNIDNNIDNTNHIQNEDNNEINEINENEDKNSSDLFSLDEEEDDEIKKQRIELIEKMTKKTDEVVIIPDFNIFDYSKIDQGDFISDEKKY